MLRLIIRKISLLLVKVKTGIKTSLGIKFYPQIGEDYSSLFLLGWIFLLGMPIGTLFFGPLFNLHIWFLILIGYSFLENLDYTISVLQEIK